MLRVYACLTTEHDFRLVALAALVCALASVTAINLLVHVLRSERTARRIWLAAAAVTTGFGIWATHFIAMLAFQPGVPSGYNILLTAASLAAAVAVTGLGLGLAVTPRVRHGRAIGGAVIGGGIAAMHYTGMAAFEIAGRIVWDAPLVLASIGLGAVLAAAALPAALRTDKIRSRLLGALLLTLAICSHHFTAMGAAAIIPDPRFAVSEAALPAGLMAMAVAFVSIAIIGLALAGLALERRERRALGERARIRMLADAAIEGLIVCDGDAIVTANRSFTELACAEGEEADGRSLASLFPALTSDQLARAALKPIEATLHPSSGRTIPVELFHREFVYLGKPHRILAVRDIRERKEAEEHIRFLAHHDPLTKLPNRATFNDRLEAELAGPHDPERRLALFFLDLDRFKEINDDFGHAVGDAVLQFVAEKVTGVLAPDHLFARLGGDEFAVIAPGLADPAEVARTAEAILEALGQDASSQLAGIAVGASVGVATFPGDATDRATLLSHADAALYEAKAEGRGTWRSFEAAMGAHLRQRRQIQHDIRYAIARDEVSLVYQPQARVDSDEVLCFEALVRWNHRTLGPISPGLFIPLAEECRAILQIGEWVLRTACADAALWRRPLRVAVNVSAVQLHAGNLPELVEDVLRETGLDPCRLELEFTETALIRDMGQAMAEMRRLKGLGVQIAMDDFGTGFSSLTNLRAFPCDKIKIDQSFVRAVDTCADSAAIVRAVLGLAKGLNLSVVAEGVETDEELCFLRREGCEGIQGYLIGRPAPIAEFELHTRGAEPITLRRPEARNVRVLARGYG